MSTTTKPTNIVAIDQEDCPGCGEAGVRWIGSTEGFDTWACGRCGYDWTILIDEQAGKGEA